MSSALISVGNFLSNRGLKYYQCPGHGLSYIICHLNSSIMGLLKTYPYQTLAAALFFGLILFRRLKKLRSGNPKGLPLPPGPKGYPLIGSLLEMPIDKPWLVYDEWRKTYGKSLIIDSLLSQIFSFFYRWYDIFQGPWPALFDFKLLWTDHWPVREKVFKLLWQNAITYAGWAVRIRFLSIQTLWKKRLFQNELGFQLRLSALRRVVAKTQEIISSLFQH